MYSSFYGEVGNVIKKYLLTLTSKGYLMTCYTKIIRPENRSNLTVACKIMSL